jgi:hypothetical protein
LSHPGHTRPQCGHAPSGGQRPCSTSSTGTPAQRASLTATLTPLLSFELLLGGGAGIFAYAYGGTGHAFGAAVQNELALNWPDGTSGNASSNAIVLATTVPAVWTNVLDMFGAVLPGLPDGITYVGEQNIGNLCPLVGSATLGIIARLKAQLAAMLELALQLSLHPPTFAATLSIVVDLVASLTAALSLTLPGVSFQLAAVAKLVAKINAELALLAKLALVLASSTGGVMVFTYSGPGNALGTSLTTALSGSWPNAASGSAHANALVLGTVTPAVWTVMSAFFGGA